MRTLKVMSVKTQMRREFTSTGLDGSISDFVGEREEKKVLVFSYSRIKNS